MVFDGVDRLLSRTNQEVIVYECRRCGTTVDEDIDTCPECSAEAIVQHRIS
ncbi:hypothetical protein [Natrinema salinisoli]|uniref:hypothetical protein n=1 Tax=Natrinema salinisoli TaxID=2878535 RepID=UPI001CF03FB5|nr:hypothetical protein [Natrinema salinisoli]